MIRKMNKNDGIAEMLYDMYMNMDDDLDFSESMGGFELFSKNFSKMAEHDYHYVYVSDGKAVGYYLLMEAEFKSKILFGCTKMCYMGILVVEKSMRNQGIGTALLNHAKSECLRMGYEALNLEVLSSSDSNYRFYAKNGFDEMSKHMICFFE